MAAKLVECEHCGGKKNCTISGGRSCRICMEAAGLGRKGWATVRCSYCGGKGKVWMKEEEEGAAAGEAEGAPDAAGEAEAPAAAE